MLKTLFADENRLGFKIEGHLSADELGELYTLIENSLAQFEQTHIYIEVGDYRGFDASFVAQNVHRSFAMLGKLSAFGRVAVVADQPWLRRAARFESALLPHIAYEIYPLAERETALAWVKGESASPHQPALSIIETDRADVLAFEVTGRLETDDLHRISKAVETLLADHEKISLLARFTRYAGIDATSLGDAEYVRMKWSMIGRLDRYALVGAPGWIASLASGFSLLVPGEIRAFDAEDEDEAWQWLDAAPKAPAPNRKEADLAASEA